MRSRRAILDVGDACQRLLCGLLPAQFEEVVYRTGIPVEFLSRNTQAQAERAIEVIRYMEVRGEIGLLAAILTDPRYAGSSDGLAVVDSPEARIEAVRKLFREARARRQMLRESGVTTDEVTREIRELRRQRRERGSLRAGDCLGNGRYMLAENIGYGKYGVVWRACDQSAGRDVAIKVPHEGLSDDDRERLFRGAREMMQLTHAAIVRILVPQEQEDAVCYFVMEYVAGGNLEDAVLARRIAPSRVIPLVLQVGDALAEVHRWSRVHRDVKPLNILLDEHGNPKLTDFDLVWTPDTTGGTHTAPPRWTPVYSAPEVVDAPQEATERADVYGLGMTAIFCFAGRKLSSKIWKNPERTIAELGCPDGVRRVLSRAVAWEPGDRFANAAEMCDAFRNASRPVLASGGGRLIGIDKDRVKRRLVAPVMMSSFALVVLLALIGFVVSALL